MGSRASIELGRRDGHRPSAASANEATRSRRLENRHAPCRHTNHLDQVTAAASVRRKGDRSADRLERLLHQ